MSKANQTKAIAFCRVAATQQHGSENYLQKQAERIKKFADQNSIEIVREWKICADSRLIGQQRFVFHEMLDYCKKTKDCKYLIVDDIDRICRSIDDYYYWKRSFQFLGIKLLTTRQPLSDQQDSRPAFDELISVYMAESSNEQRTQYVKDRMLAKTKSGYYPHNPHFGYRTSRIPGLHVPDSPVWNVLKNVFEAVADDRINVDDGYQLLKQKIVAVQHTQKSRSGNVKKYQYLRLLADPYYAGLIRCGDTTVKGLHEPLVSEQKWQCIHKRCTEHGHKRSNA